VAQIGGGVEPASPAPERVAELIRSLAIVMRQSSITELDLELGPMSVRLRRPAAGQETTGGSQTEPDGLAAAPMIPTDLLITAPMIGTFYSSATPGAQPFVAEGDEISVGQTIGIIEAMKIMNEIAADRSGVVETVLVGNGEPVEYGSPLMRLGIGRSDRH